MREERTISRLGNVKAVASARRKFQLLMPSGCPRTDCGTRRSTSDGRRFRVGANERWLSKVPEGTLYLNRKLCGTTYLFEPRVHIVRVYDPQGKGVLVDGRAHRDSDYQRQGNHPDRAEQCHFCASVTRPWISPSLDTCN